MITIFLFWLTAKVLRELGFYLICLYLLFFIVFHFLGFVLRFFLYVDLISVGISLLTLLVFLLIILCAYYDHSFVNKWSFLYYFLFILIIFLTLTFFVGSFLLFYLFFEFILIPTFILILGWGYRPNRVQASFYIVFYTLFRSLPLLVYLFSLLTTNNRLIFLFSVFNTTINSSINYWWLFIVLVFIVKLPLFFLHVWLPKAHVDAPLLGSMLLAGVLLKLGGYGLYKIILFSYISFKDYLLVFNCFSILGALFMAFVCIRQVDIKRVVAYSSVVHIGPVFRSFILLTYSGLLGGYWLIICHGLCSICLFYVLNIVYFWLGRRNIFVVRGGLLYTPFFSFVWFLYCICNIGFPPRFNFFSELVIVFNLIYFREIFFCVFFVLLMLRGFYNIIIYLYFNHGDIKVIFTKENFFNIKDFILFFVSLFILIFFVLFAYLI